MVMRPLLINIMAKAAEQAGRALERDFSRIDRLRVAAKGPADFVSTADFKAQEILREELSAARPDIGFLMEEEDGVDDSAPKKERWIVDPLDGTSNFIHGIPHWAISIAVEREGAIVSGLIYSPLTNDMFWAEKGVGAYLGYKGIRVSGRTDLSECLLATNIMYKGDRKAAQLTVDRAGEMCKHTSGARHSGCTSLDLAYVAAGRYDGFWTAEGIGLWDIAAGALIVKEAGGKISPLVEGEDPMKSTRLLASNPKIHDKTLEIIRSV